MPRVRKGGCLVFSGRDDDPFQGVKEWWNTGECSFAAPSDHLMGLMGIEASSPAGEYRYGKGIVRIMRNDPKEYVLTEGGADEFVSAVCGMYRKATEGKELQFKNSFYLERGAYDIVSVMTESTSGSGYTVKGTLIDLFDPALPVYSEKEVMPGEQGYFLNVDRVTDKKPQVLASAGREYDETVTGNGYSYVVKSPVNTINVSRVLLPYAPVSVKVDGKEVIDASAWDAGSMTYLLSFDNSPDGVHVGFEW